jgi:excisionase family DNA binding protein
MAIECLTYSVSEAAQILGISERHAWKSVRQGDLPSFRLGGRVLIPRARLQDLLTGPESGQGDRNCASS